MMNKLEAFLSKQNISFSYCDDFMSFAPAEDLSAHAFPTETGAINIEILDAEGETIAQKEYKSVSSVIKLIKAHHETAAAIETPQPQSQPAEDMILYTSRDGLDLMKQNKSFYAWTKESTSFEPPNEAIAVSSLDVLPKANGNYLITGPARQLPFTMKVTDLKTGDIMPHETVQGVIELATFYNKKRVYNLLEALPILQANDYKVEEKEPVL